MENFLEPFEQVCRPHRMDGENELPMTWDDLKQFCNSMTPEELTAPLRAMGEERGGKVYGISKSADDLINPSGEGLETVHFYATSIDADDKEVADTEEIIMLKGQHVLDIDI